MTVAQFLVAVCILAAAGFSDLLGQSAVLFLNRVPARRFLLCLGSGWLLFLFSALGWSVWLWLLGWLTHLDLSLLRCFFFVALSHSPQILGVFVLLPYLGAYLQHILRAWVFFNLVVAVSWATGAPLPTAIFCCLPGWLLHFSLTHLEMFRLERFQAWLWRTLT